MVEFGVRRASSCPILGVCDNCSFVLISSTKYKKAYLMKIFYYESQCLSENSLEVYLDEGLISRCRILVEEVGEVSPSLVALVLVDHLARHH